MSELVRVLEPEVMDSWEEATDYDSMDHRAVNELFANDLIQAGFSGGDVLDVGTGTAQIPVAICKKIPNCRIMAIDAAANMLDVARYNLEAAGVVDRVLLQKVDAKSMPFSDQKFDWVISNSIIHHIPDPFVCLAESVRVAKVGGGLFFRDLARPENQVELNRLVEVYAAGANDHQRKMFAESLAAALTLEEVRAMISRLGFEPATVTLTSDRHWTWNAKKA